MATGKRTYGASLNAENRDDAKLMDWLDGMDRGGPANNIKQGLLTEYDIQAGVSEIVPSGTGRQIQSALATIEDQRKEIERLRAQLAESQDDLLILRSQSAKASAAEPELRRLVDGVLKVINNNTKVMQQIAAHGVNTNGASGARADSDQLPIEEETEPEYEDPDDPLVKTMIASSFEF